MKMLRTGSRKIQMFSEKSFRSGTTKPAAGKLRGALRHSNTKPQLKPKKFGASKPQAASGLRRKASPSPQPVLPSEVHE